MITEIYHDGIAFYTDDKDYEIAFYSNITNRVSYNYRNGYKDIVSLGGVTLPYEDNLKVMEEIEKYRRELDKGDV